MAKSNSTSMYIDLVDVQPELLDAIDVHRREGFVDLWRIVRFSSAGRSHGETHLIYVDVVLIEAGSHQDHRYGD